ncbi:MAG TPA: TRAM domain-containing protein [Longimicrobiales bacterium]|nr:TRAM domain-containing protein [Longimicrobiales bacterium]
MATSRLAVGGGMTESYALAVGDRTHVRIRAISSGGAGVGDLPDGRVVFVHRTAPGDLVDIRVRKLHPRWGEGDLQEILEASPDRVTPPCRHYAQCGGCTLQHLAYEDQLLWKGRFVTEAMERIGKQSVEVPPVEPSPAQTRYRNRVTFTLRRLSAGHVVAGFHALGRPAHVLDVRGECLLPEPEILEVWGALHDAWKRGLRPLPSTKELRVTLRALPDGVVVVVRGGARGWDPALLLANVPNVVSVWHHAGGTPRAEHLAGRVVYEDWGDERLPVGGQAFVQVNRAAAESLVSYVLAQVGAGRTAVDAYCGVGVYGRALARDGWTVTGIEVDPEACKGASFEPPETFRVLEGPVEEHLPSALPADLVILNPPRTGLQEWVPGMLALRPPPRLIYVSCDPATLARDAARLGGVFGLESLRAFDLFPQTSHVETVAVFRSNRTA